MIEEDNNVHLEEDNDASYEDDRDTEGQGEESGEGGEHDADTITLTKAELDARLKERAKEQDRRWKERLKGAEGDEESEDSGKERRKESDYSKDPQVIERLDRADLRAEGIRDKKEQDTVLDLARKLGMDVMDALQRPAVQAELKALRDKHSTPRPSGTTPRGKADEVDYWVTQFQKNGKSAPTLEMRRKVRQKLIGQ